MLIPSARFWHYQTLCPSNHIAEATAELVGNFGTPGLLPHMMVMTMMLCRARTCPCYDSMPIALAEDHPTPTPTPTPPPHTHTHKHTHTHTRTHVCICFLFVCCCCFFPVGWLVVIFQSDSLQILFSHD